VANPPTRSYQLCWDSNPPNGKPGTAKLYEEYRVGVGTFTMNGPYQGQSKTCNLGASCTIQVEGIGLTNTNHVLLISKYGGPCGNIPPDAPMVRADMPGMTNPRVVTDDQFDNKFDLGIAEGGGSYSGCRVAEPREMCIGVHYRICWAHGVDTNALGDYPFLVDVGSFSLYGVYGTYSVECALGSVCSFSIIGLVMDKFNQVLIVDNRSSCGDSDPAIASFDGLQNPRRASGVSTVRDENGGGMEATFRLGRSISGLIGTYRLCWGFDPLVVGDFKVEVGPFHFVESAGPQKCSVWDSHCFQKSEL